MSSPARETVPPPPKDDIVIPVINRLWIGNLDSRLTEFQLLKMVRKFGELAEYDFLFHRTGPLAGQPRGYAFVTYKNPQNAKTAMNAMDGFTILGRRVVVRWAHSHDDSKYQKPKEKAAPSILTGGKGETTTVKNVSKESKIAALEAKLKMLDDNSPEVRLTPDIGVSSSRPTSVTYTYVQQSSKNQNEKGRSSGSSRDAKPKHTSSHPYDRLHRGKR
ncbi:putative RNA-binding protein 18 isoform X2 [Oratosquilla oratoria]|uniref:putative RNA-binding protein 18 isoform X2 n=1 Tax=Oratosquilla oratoria TaxID=337810 RepID=UPI003F75CD76